MSKILKEGKLNKRMAWFCTCDTCGSELRIIQGDPIATDPVIYNCDIGRYAIHYICPVCRQKKRAESGSDMYVDKKCKATYKEITLDLDDMKEIEDWKVDLIKKVVLSTEEKEWINNRRG